jgi:hypothetical protein
MASAREFPVIGAPSIKPWKRGNGSPKWPLNRCGGVFERVNGKKQGVKGCLQRIFITCLGKTVPIPSESEGVREMLPLDESLQENVPAGGSP